VRDPSAARGVLSVLVVDDEALARERLVRMLAKIEGVAIAGEADSATSALQKIASIAPDLVMLDIEMPGMDGLELAGSPGIPPIVFTTAHVQFAADAFELDAVDFLTKPIRAERLDQAIDRARRRLDGAPAAPKSPARVLAVHDGGTIRFVDVASVNAFIARDKYVELVHEGKELLLRESLDALERRLGDAFVRVHRNALVRIDAIRELTTGDNVLAQLSDGTRVEVSRRAAPNLRRLLKKDR
jgi:DNA-binding LytR/AlgR family response regulator